jgi:putative membrane protein
VNQNATDSAVQSTTKTPSDATTSAVENKESNEVSSNTNPGKEDKPLSDKDFVMRAAQGGMTEVELGKVATEKGQSSDVKDFGARMVKDHTQANDQLKSLAEKKGIALSSSLDARHQGQVDRLSKLSGTAFDKAYVTNQVRAHEMTVKLFQQEAQSGQDPDLKAFANQTLPTLKDHCSSIMSIQNNGSK